MAAIKPITIRPVSDLRNYSDVLKDVSYGNPVFLTRNGRGAYIIMDIDEYNEMEKSLDEYLDEKLGKRRYEEE
ncbi:MAG: type II toxin-antitoxin system prevent-host-death family antitoxin [Lachnospiraceae bacterium]|nr:type II toxin-antitoxin system prevent-host-death family antitoxin [Ruminococcus sp.]MCM1274176.1 type II toxin-antitoxin system prevent-host-death family antitoxin [Lachnospiraceae bacterium]